MAYYVSFEYSMKYFMFKGFLFIKLICLTGYILNAQSIENINPQAFKEKVKLERGYLLDVRSDWEYADGFLEGALNLDIHGDMFQLLVAKLDQQRCCYVYCFSGSRSTEAAHYLISKGFKKVYNLQGGIVAWQKAGLPIVKPVK